MPQSVNINIIKFNNKEEIEKLVKDYLNNNTNLDKKEIGEIFSTLSEIPNEKELKYFFRFMRNHLINFQGLEFYNDEDDEEIDKYLKRETKYFNKFKENINYPCYFCYFKSFIDVEDEFSSDLENNNLDISLEYFKNNNIECFSEFVILDYDYEF